jgi:peptide-methionine (S)-S-oxide reductase
LNARNSGLEMNILFSILLLLSFTGGKEKMELATFGMGCFWCSEAMFTQLKGVQKVQSGFSGGTTENPSYRDVCTGETGHAEVIQITYDPEQISYTELLKVFFTMHDPTTLNRQGADMGTQYRSVIFTHSPEQRNEALKVIELLTAEKLYPNPIVTQVEEYKNFYPAEDYHNNYFQNNPNEGYCRMVVAPKVEKFQKVFETLLKQKK